MGLINDGISLLLNLAPVAAIVSLFLAGLAWRREGSFFQDSRFGLWIFWAMVWLTLPGLLSWFSTIFGIPEPAAPTDIGTAFLNMFYNDAKSFVSKFVIGYLAPILAGFLLFRSVIDVAEGKSPLHSVLNAMLLLTIGSIVVLFQSWEDTTPYALPDMLAALWNFIASRIFPIGAGIAICGAILNFAFGKPSLRLVASAGGLLTVPALWYLILAMVGQ